MPDDRDALIAALRQTLHEMVDGLVMARAEAIRRQMAEKEAERCNSD